jgi:Asp-tRNA(Asn)/Glu-tRNA(Gln) amidotransferase A subunit family amidase
MQLLGPYWSEQLLLQAAHAFEQARPFTARPPINVD